ncbi:hypothetical protein [Myroides sp. DW712]|uniref:hypothetical protein n=1 Tax=Myroides sp. DW712 TaxID=3389800 RepID=UPI0039794D81
MKKLIILSTFIGFGCFQMHAQTQTIIAHGEASITIRSNGDTRINCNSKIDTDCYTMTISGPVTSYAKVDVEVYPIKEKLPVKFTGKLIEYSDNILIFKTEK